MCYLLSDIQYIHTIILNYSIPPNLELKLSVKFNMLEKEVRDKEAEDYKSEDDQLTHKGTSKVAMSLQKSQDHRKFISQKFALNKLMHPIELLILEGKKIIHTEKEVEGTTRHVVLVLNDKHFTYMPTKKDKPQEGKKEMHEESKNKEIGKYFKERYYLFSKYDEGIIMDTESIAFT